MATKEVVKTGSGANDRYNGGSAPVCVLKDVDFQVNKLFQAVTSCLGRPFKVNSARNLRSIVKQWDPLKNTEKLPDPTPRVFKCSYQASHFFDRYFYDEELGEKSVLEDKALRKFQENLIRGEYWNAVFAGYCDSTGFRKLSWAPSWVSEVLETAALRIQNVLGQFDYEEVFTECGHGPNGSVGVRRLNAYQDVKSCTFDMTIGVRQEIMPAYLAWAERLRIDTFGPGDEWEFFLQSPFALVDANRLLFVPKKFDQLRTIQAEPTWNLFFQLGTGRVIQKRLLNANIDLTTQPGCHARLALLGSLYPEIGIATVDWSEASNRIWTELVRFLVPTAWFDWFTSIRSPNTEYTSKSGETAVMELPMIGTMGNGFTFPLQTLIFWGIMQALCEVKGHEPFVSAFGDDCILPATAVADLETLSSWLGWEANRDKTFSQGGFRESCGADGYLGIDCRPFKIERPSDRITVNGVRSWAYSCANTAIETLGDSPNDEIVYWLLDLFGSLELGPVFLVPPWEGSTAGLRCPDPHPFYNQGVDHLFSVPIQGNHAVYEYSTTYHEGKDGQTVGLKRRTVQRVQGWKYKKLTPVVEEREVTWEDPYYWLSLGLTPPAPLDEWLRDRRLAAGSREPEEQAPWMGQVPMRQTVARYKPRSIVTGNWTWWTDPITAQPLSWGA